MSIPILRPLVIASTVLGTTLSVAASGQSGAGFEEDALSQIADLRRQLDSQSREIAELRQEEGDTWLTEQRAGEIRGIVEDVLADADTRTSFQDSGAMAGWNRGFFLASPDGNFKLKISGQIQLRYVVNHANGYDSAEKDDKAPYLWGAENRRTKLKFSGHVIDPSWTYGVKGAFTREKSGTFLLEEAWVAKDLGDGLEVKVGQFKAPWLREELVSSSRQLTVERSLVNEYFNQGYSQGIELSYATDDFKVSAWTGDGIGSRGLGPARFSSQNTPWNTTSTSYSFVARGEWKLAGDWKQFKDFSSRRGSDFAAMAGISGVTQRANQNIGDANGTIATGVTADLTLDFDGASIFVSGVWTNVTGPESQGARTNNPFGVTVQGGYFVSEDVEVFGRYEYMNYDLDNQPIDEVGKYDGITVGANWFVNSAVKVSLDWSINFASLDNSSPNSAFVSNSAGFRPDKPGETNQWAFRAQLQLLF
ncbi:MAG: hypothetical protein GY895_07005 [Phycisphaera sp.]|nr:hypothetical protein [Phycisphaera sp.]